MKNYTAARHPQSRIHICRLRLEFPSLNYYTFSVLTPFTLHTNAGTCTNNAFSLFSYAGDKTF